MRAYIVVDLGFGDGGKGVLTDFLVRRLNASLVVRYNGGAQAGHNVITPDGRHHTFAQFGSGSFVAGVKTFLSRFMVLHPTALLVEGETLQNKGLPDIFSRLRISDQALVITPFHQAANHLRELLRGDGRHGSCGVGVGETVEDALVFPEAAIRAGDLAHPARLRQKLLFIREQKRLHMLALYKNTDLSADAAEEWSIFESEELIENWLSAIRRFNRLGLVVPDALLQEWLQQADAVVFEGAQGVLLDAARGFHPYTTWSNCTAENARLLIDQLAPGSTTSSIGVLRSYMVRHGPGPLPGACEELKTFIREHNRCNPWQGELRYAWFDALLARYALSLTGKPDFLAVTHLDILPRLPAWKYTAAYHAQALLSGAADGSDLVTAITPPLSLAEREDFSRALSQAVPVLQSCPVNETAVLQKVEQLLGLAVGITFNGPGANNAQLHLSL